MSHPFGDLVTQHLSRKHGLSQNKLAEGIDQDPAVVSDMCNGRRLSGRQARERVLAIIGWFIEQKVLCARAEANALLEAAGLARLYPESPAEAHLLDALEPDPLQAGGAASPPQPEASGRRRTSRTAIWLAAAALIVVGMAAGLGLPALRGVRATPPLWQEDFAPLHADCWQKEFASATWEDTPGPGAVLRENHPLQSYGKAESVPIAVDMGDHPILQVSVTAVDPGASYSVQILDKVSDTSRDILTELVYPGEHTIDLAQATGWQGLHVFTINLWVGGESKSVTFDRISVEANGPPAR